MTTLTIDYGRSSRPFPHFWQSTGFTPAALLLQPDMQQTLAYVGSIPHGGITFVRIHFLLDLVAGEGFDTDRPRYDFTRLDTGLDVLLRNNLKPFFELMGNPSGWFTDFTNDAELHALKRLMRDVARHCIDRYGQDEVRSWYFETWNEPDGGWWHQWPRNIESFLNYYDACSEGLKEADPALRFGGPGSCRTFSDLLKAMLAHCDNGRNYFSGETGVRLDFISVHEKGADAHNEDLNPDTMGIVNREIALVQYLREKHPRLAKLPFMNNECDPQVGWAHYHTWHGRPYYAAIIAKMIDQHLTKMADAMGVDYALLSNDNGFLGGWGNRTHLARFGKEKQLGLGQFELIKKPALNVMAMLALLGDQRVTVAGALDAAGDLGIIATRRGDDQVAILIYKSRDTIMSSGSEPVELTLDGVPFESGMLIHYRIDEAHGDPYQVWERSHHPDLPNAEQAAAMRREQELVTLELPREVKLAGGKLSLRFDLPLPSVSLILLHRKPAVGPAKVQRLRVEHYQGLTKQGRVMLLWDSLPSRAIRTYEILHAGAPDGPFHRVNEQNLICTAFLHVHNAPVARGAYRVRAVDYWGRTGEESDVVVVG